MKKVLFPSSPAPLEDFVVREDDDFFFCSESHRMNAEKVFYCILSASMRDPDLRWAVLNAVDEAERCAEMRNYGGTS